MIRKFYMLFLSAAFFICLGTVTANADTIFSDIPSSGDLFQIDSAAPVAGSALVGGIQTPASQFKAGGTGSFDVTQIDVAVDKRFADVPGFPASGNFQVQIWNSSGPLGVSTAIPTGAALYTSPEEFPTDVYDTVHPLFTINVPIGALSLTGGNVYFMSVNAFGPNDDAAWHRNVLPPSPPTGFAVITGLRVTSFDGGATWIDVGDPTELPAFDILGTASATGVPEPTTMVLLGLGLLGLGGFRKRLFKK